MLAADSGVTPGRVADVRRNGDHAVVEVRVTREEADVFEQGADVLIDRRPLWYLRETDSGTVLELRRRDDDSHWPLVNIVNVDDERRPLAERICDLLNEHGDGT